MYILYILVDSLQLFLEAFLLLSECPFNKQEFSNKQLFRLAIVGHAHYRPSLTCAFCMRDYRLWRTACFRTSCEIRKEKGENSVYRTKRKNIDYWPNIISSYWQMYIQGCQQPTLMCLANLKNVWNRLEHILHYNFVAHLIKVAYVKSKNKP